MKTLLAIVLSVAIALAIQNFYFRPGASSAAGMANTDSAFARVTKTGTLRCAYGVYPPWVDKDPNSGKLSGIMPDVMAAFEQANGIKVEWGPEIDWGNIAATLQSGKADAFCAGMYMTPKRGRVIAGTTPVFFSVMDAFARQDDKRFDNNLDRINQPDVRISVNMGDLSEEMAQRLFPLAQRVAKSSLGGEAELFLNVANGKADIALSGPSNLTAYNQTNPASALRQVELAQPIMTFRTVVAVDISEGELLRLINATFHNLVDSGAVDRILRNDTGKDYGISYFPPQSRSE